jgi:transposase
MLFVQDNASIHTAKVVKDWFKNSGIPILESPPYSPDLNLIKIVWAWLKEWITTNYPDLITMGISEAPFKGSIRLCGKVRSLFHKKKLTT